MSLPPSRSSSPDNDVFAISTTLVPVRAPKEAGTTEITFDNLLSPALILHEDLHNGCGGQLWPAGMLLSKYMLTHHRSSLMNKSVIEIGAGGGLVGLAVALGCEINKTITITDQVPMLALMKKNILLNNLSQKVQAEVFDWGTNPPESIPCPPDVVLAADCVYFEPAFPLLLQTLEDLIGPATICYFCFKKRRKADMRFIKDMLKRFDVVEINWEGKENGRRDGIWLYEVRRKKKSE